MVGTVVVVIVIVVVTFLFYNSCIVIGRMFHIATYRDTLLLKGTIKKNININYY
jgi:hypothetical protein